jgi:hypothetical protein
VLAAAAGVVPFEKEVAHLFELAMRVEQARRG